MFRSSVPALIVFCLSVNPFAFSAEFDAGMSAYRNMQYEKSWEIWGPLAEQGDARAQLWVGILYILGKGVPANHVLGCKWLLRAEPTYYQSVELFALLAICATAAGRYAGLDFFICAWWQGAFKPKQDAPAPETPAAA